MTFAHPQMLWLLLVFPPALVVFFWWSWRKRQALMAQFIQARLLPALVAGLSPQRQKLRLACLVLAVVCLIVALARPQWGFTWQEVKQRGVDIVVAIDVSKSMLATDITPNRLARAKLAALDLMQQAKSDRLGLVGFAGSAFLPCPLTIDDAAFRQSLEALDVNSISQGGTALADAINTALTAFKEGDNHKILVLMTDGEDQDSGALEAAKKAAEAGLRIYTIGIGTAEGELLRIQNPNGSSDYVRDEQGNVVKSHLNERLLQEIASATQGGFYLPLRGAKTIDTLYSEGLSKLPKSEHQEKLVKQYYERFQWPLTLAIVLLLVEMLLPERKRDRSDEARSNNSARSKSPRVPSKKPLINTPLQQGASEPAVDANRFNGFPQGSSPSNPASTPLALLLLLAVPCLTFGSPSSALRDYQAGKFDRAQKEYETLLQKKNDDPRLHFNAGAAAYRNGQFEEAAKQFNEALATPDLNLQARAYYNRGNAQYFLGDKNPDPSKRTDNWQKALKDYELSLKLNPQDGDAKFNQEFVKKRLEELKQQQQQQQQNKQDKSDQKNQDQQQQQQQQQNNQQKQDQDKQQQQSQQQQNQQNQQDKQQQQQQQADQQSQEQKKQQAQQQQQDKQQQQAQQASGQDKDKDKPEDQESAQAVPAGQMTPDQARQLMDAQKGEEKMLMLNPENKPANANHPLRDW